MLQLRMADANGATDPDLEVKADPALGAEAARNASSEKKAAAPLARGVKIVAKGDPYARGASSKPVGNGLLSVPTNVRPLSFDAMNGVVPE